MSKIVNKEMMSKCKVNDCYHRAFFYVMGIAGETRANINQMFDFKQDCIEPERIKQSYYAKENSATEYATDKVSHTAERVTAEGVYQFDKHCYDTRL